MSLPHCMIRTAEAVPLRIGMACGPVVAGVVGSRRFFYDVWGDAVNVASRMESTDSVGRIQVPEDVYERLKHDFVLQERGPHRGQGQGRYAHLVSNRPQARAKNPPTCVPKIRARPTSDQSPYTTAGVCARLRP